MKRKVSKFIAGMGMALLIATGTATTTFATQEDAEPICNSHYCYEKGYVPIRPNLIFTQRPITDD